MEAIATGNVNIEPAYQYPIQTENSKKQNEKQYHILMNSIMFLVTSDVLNKENMEAQLVKTMFNTDRNLQYFQQMNLLLYHTKKMCGHSNKPLQGYRNPT